MSVYIPHGLGISNLYEWAVGENYTPCSQTCGIGTEKFSVILIITIIFQESKCKRYIVESKALT